MKTAEESISDQAEKEAEKYVQKLKDRLKTSGIIPNQFLLNDFKNVFISGYLTAIKPKKRGLLSRIFNWQ